MTVGQLFTKIDSFIENRQIFMLLNCNCTKLANFEDFWATVSVCKTVRPPIGPLSVCLSCLSVCL